MTNRRGFLRLTGLSSLAGLAACDLGFDIRPGKRPSVVVVGGGYGGATAAKYLRLLDPGVRITLVEQNASYLSCPGSNEVIAGITDPKHLRRDYRELEQNHRIARVTAQATGIDPQERRLKLADDSSIHYDRLIVAPGIAFRWGAIEGYDPQASEQAPHAWKAGPQTALLRQQVKGMRDGGTILIVVPGNPYRCPPGPYERASLIAHFLKRHKPHSKVIILDAKTQFSKQKAFQAAWAELYPGMIEWVSSEKEGRVERVDADRRRVYTEFGEHYGDVLNVIPPQKAGKLAELCGLVDASGWCPVDPVTFESRLVPSVHVIGDACIADPMPKSAFAANSQAKCCAAAVVDLLNDRPPVAATLINHCYSFLSRDQAISITGVYRYSPEKRQLVTLSSGETPPGGNRREEAQHARDWKKAFAADVFG